MQRAFKLALSMTLLYWLALSLDWDLPKYGALAIALISLDTTGASLQKGLMRIAGTTVGLAVGLLGLALFAQDSFLTLAYLASYLAAVGYFMQSSRFPYAWFVAGFLPPLVWASTYGKIDNAFSYATFRYLETTAGVVIYTAVAGILWPERAGTLLGKEGHALLRQTADLLNDYRRQLAGTPEPEETVERRGRLVGSVSKMNATLAAAYNDTPAVARQKPLWERFQRYARLTVDSLELWRQSIDDCSHLPLDRILPEGKEALDRLELRYARMAHVWQTRSSGDQVIDVHDHDRPLLEVRPLKLNRELLGQLSYLDRAAVLSFVKQLELVERSSVSLLSATRELARLATPADTELAPLPESFGRSAPWGPQRLAVGLLPAISFLLAWVFWVHFNPPTGPSVPSMAATFGLMIAMSSGNALSVVPVMAIAMGLFVAPIYFLVMPALSTGFELLTLIFSFVFCLGTFLVGRLAILRTVVLSLFVMMTGINNSQSYSFAALVDGGLMIVMGLVIVGLVQTLISPMNAERALVDSVRQFFGGCVRLTASYTFASESEAIVPRAFRRRLFGAIVVPAAGRIRAVAKHLDYRRLPESSPEHIQQLADALQQVSGRLQALELSHRNAFSHETILSESVSKKLVQVRAVLCRTFARWQRLDGCPPISSLDDELRSLSGDWDAPFETLASGGNRRELSDESLADVYATLGALRGLVDSMRAMDRLLGQIGWQQLSTPRF